MGVFRKFSGLRGLFEVLVALAIVSLCIGLAQSFLSVVTLANKEWVDNAHRPTDAPKVTMLMNSAVYYGIIRYDPDSDRLIVMSRAEIARNLTPPDNMTAREGNNEKGLFSFDTTSTLLWNSRGPGIEIRREIERITESRSVLAFATGYDTRKLCASTAGQGSPKTCPPGWILSLSSAQTNSADLTRDRNSAILQELATESPDLRTFAPMAFSAIAEYSDWHAITTRFLKQESIFLSHDRSVLSLPNQPAPKHLSVMLIGKLKRTVEGTTEPDEIVHYCLDPASAEARLKTCATPDIAIAHVLRYAQSFRSAPPQLEVEPIQVPLVVGEAVTAGGSKKVRLSDRITLTCRNLRREQTNIHCLPTWTPSNRVVRLTRDLSGLYETPPPLPKIEDSVIGPNREDVATPDSDPRLSGDIAISSLVDLASETGLALTPEARNLRLAQALGTTSGQFGKPLAYLSSLPPDRDLKDFRVTIDPVLQKIALETLAEVLEAPGRELAKDSNIPREWDEHRRAGFILLDLQADSGAGAIRAAIGLPSQKIPENDWMLSAMQYADPLQSPLLALAWEGIDGRMVPGSVFKVLSAMALIQSATGVSLDIDQSRRAVIRDAITGMPNRDYRQRVTLPGRDGLDLTDKVLTVPRHIVEVQGIGAIRDFSNTYPIATARKLSVNGCGIDKSVSDQSYIYGLCTALARSSNIWFAGMAIYQDKLKLEQMAAGESMQHPTAQAQLLVRLGLHKRFSLMRSDADLDQNDSLLPRAERVVDELHPNLAREDAVGPTEKADTIRFAANTSFGQNIQASPLAAAAIAASAAIGKVVHPYLMFDNSRNPLPTEMLFAAPEAAPLVREMHRGLRAVVQSEGGTAYNAFHGTSPAAAIADRVYGKTGTAQIVDQTVRKSYLFGSWFIGWITDADNPAVPRYAFACAVTHLDAAESVCPTITARFLARIERVSR